MAANRQNLSFGLCSRFGRRRRRNRSYVCGILQHSLVFVVLWDDNDVSTSEKKAVEIERTYLAQVIVYLCVGNIA
ncbi:hypothetical protein ACLKA6_011551 [Drosophila palustris]